MRFSDHITEITLIELIAFSLVLIMFVFAWWLGR